ncbi:hypothetical protein PG997_011562 [Apiospora hydei]|uniref:RING-type domain-containing protein n=1 Tax=Apiospora hydei TaxID=1337664 RepID=A0ABR1VN70_9PEZI
MPSSETPSTFTTWVANFLQALSFTKRPVNQPVVGTELVKAEIPKRVITAHYIRDFAKHLEKAGQEGRPLLHSDCIVCRRTLSISSSVGDLVKEECELAGDETAAKSKLEFYEKHDIEHTVVLRCGHLIGAECLREAVEFYASGHPSAFRPNICFHCRAKTACDGCDDNLLADGSFDPFHKWTTWPLGESDTMMYQPWAGFLRVGLTAAEKDPKAKRYCQRCTYYQILRKFSEIALTFPACDKFASAEECQQWLRQRLHEASRVICPLTDDVRNRRIAAWNDMFLAKGRDYFVETCMGAQGRGAKLHGTVFCQCTGDIETLSPKRLRGFKRKQKRRIRDTKAVFKLAERWTERFMAIANTMPLAWYRGSEEEGGMGDAAAAAFDSSRAKPRIGTCPSTGTSASSRSWEGTRSLTRCRGSITQSSQVRSWLSWWRTLTSGSTPVRLMPITLSLLENLNHGKS